MGKPTGFLEYNRKNNSSISPSERIKNYNEFHPPMSKIERQIQGSRCMNCGVPFCQSTMILNGMVTGCPLHNLVPEWNDEIYNDNWEHALARLRKTNNFPEFTGRVCPALCEAACTCGIYDTPVTIRENELAIIENGYTNNLIHPKIQKIKSGKKIAIIGSGPSGLAAADQLNHRGHEITLYEKSDRIGGLLMYGIPNMKLDKKIVNRRIDLMKAEGVKFLTSQNIDNKKTAHKIIEKFDAVLLCCGAETPRDLNVKNRQTNDVYFAVDFLKSTTKSILDNTYANNDYISAKDKKVVIVGGGDTGNDCVGTCIRHGCKSVVQIEMMPKAPDNRLSTNPWPEWPKICKTDYGQEEAINNFGHDPRIYQTTVTKLITDKNNNLTAIEIIHLAPHCDKETGKVSMIELNGSSEIIEADLLLIAAGFLGANQNVCASFGVKPDARTNVATENGSYKTNIEKVFTAGDMHRGQSLVVWAIAEGRYAAKEVDAYLMGYTNMI